MSLIECETFYVYRLIGLRDCWDVSLGELRINSLPNISFGTKVVARNEKEALIKGKEAYEQLHKNDATKANIKDFMCAVLNVSSFHEMKRDQASKAILDLAVTLNKEFNKYCEELDIEK